MITPKEKRPASDRLLPHGATKWTDVPVPVDQMPHVLLHASGVDRPAIESAIRQILQAIGENPDREGLRDTPARVARAYDEMFAGLRQDPADHLSRVFQVEHDDMILVRDIAFDSTCEHHLLPFSGRAHIAYLPRDGQVVGLSKLARTVEVYARRPQVQERMTRQIADAIVEHLNPRGVAVLVDAQHLCMKMRGVRNGCSAMVTPVLRGELKTNIDLRCEVLNLLTHKSHQQHD